MTRAVVCALLGLMSIQGLVRAEQDFKTEDVRYANGSVSLGALLMVPRATTWVPAAVIIQGSGASDRSNAWARQIAELLVRRGVAVLLTDKRGSGVSTGDWKTSGFDELATDALAGVQLLANREEIDPARIGLVGLSQGGWVAPLAAARSKKVAFVVDVSGATVTFVEQSFVEMANTARQAGLSEGAVQEVLDLNRAAGSYLTSGDWDTYQSRRAAGLQASWKPIAEGFPASAGAPIWKFLRSVLSFDPLPYWSVLAQPVFVAYGELDERDNVPVQESVRRLEFVFKLSGKRNYEIAVLPGVGHALWNQDHELDPRFVERLASWLKANVTTVERESSSPRARDSGR